MALTYNPAAYVPGGSSPAVSKAIQSAGRTRFAAPGPLSSSTGSSVAPANTSTTTPTDPTSYYNNIIANDPLLGQTTANINAAGIQNLAQLHAQQSRALAQFGTVPTGNLPGVDSIDQTTRDLANQTTAAGLSTTAQLTKGYQTAQQQSNASLAARGLLHSGAYGQHAAEDLQNYNVGNYTATQKLMDYLQGLYSGYLQEQQTLQQQAIAAAEGAAQRASQYPVPPTTTTVNPAPPSVGNPYGGGGVVQGNQFGSIDPGIATWIFQHGGAINTGGGGGGGSSSAAPPVNPYTLARQFGGG